MIEALLGIAGLLIHATAIVSVLVVETRNPSATLAWLLALIFLPFVGVLFWLVFGRLRTRRIAKRYAVATERLAAVLERHEVHAKLVDAGGPPIDARTESLLRLGRRLTSTPASRCNQADMLVDAAEAYGAMIEAIDAAKDHVHVEFYIVQPDETGEALRDLLAHRARDGVEVRVVCDGLGSNRLPPDFWRPLIEAGGHAAVFRPVGNLLRRLRKRDRIDFRNHRKLVIVDGEVGFTGGINIGREYLGLDPEMGYWRDTHVRIEGPAVLSLQKAFAEDWFTASGEILDAAPYFPDPSGETAGTFAVQIVDSGPDRTFSPISYIFKQAFALARKRVWITSPYFVPSASVIEGLMSAALRGVDVRVLVPQKADHRLVGLAGASYFPTLLESGVRVFQYQRGFVHAKTMVVDEWVGTIGSSNMDMRSFHLNWELNAFVYGAEFAGDLARQFQRDLENAVERTQEHEKRLRFPARFARAGARLLSPLL